MPCCWSLIVWIILLSALSLSLSMFVTTKTIKLIRIYIYCVFMGIQCHSLLMQISVFLLKIWSWIAILPAIQFHNENIQIYLFFFNLNTIYIYRYKHNFVIKKIIKLKCNFKQWILGISTSQQEVRIVRHVRARNWYKDSRWWSHLCMGSIISGPLNF